MRIERSRFALFVVTLALVGGCDRNHRSPTAPIPPEVAPQTLEITGSPVIAHPGETTQLAARLTHADGTTEDVTQQARWAALDAGVTEVTAPGVVRGLSYGTSTVAATYGQNVAQGLVEIRVAPPGAFLVRGAVRTASGRPLGSALVAIQSTAGKFQVSTSPEGEFALPAQGEARLRIVEEGFVDLVRSVEVGRDEWLDLVMAQAGGSLAGNYQVTIEASRRCELPQAAMQRTFGAVVEEIEGRVYVEAIGYQFVAWGGNVGFTGSRDGDRVTLEIRDTYDDGYNLVESVSGVGNVCFAGAATGTIHEGDVSATFDGTIRVEGTDVSCSASDHRLEMVRIGAGG